MSGFKDREFSLDALRSEAPFDPSQPTSLDALHDALLVEAHLERGAELRRLTREVLGPIGQQLLPSDEAESLLDQCDQGDC